MYQVRVMLPNASCNLRCKYCLNTNNIKGIKCGIDFAKLFAKMDLVNFGCISIWGGEPLYNPNLETVLRALRTRYPDKEIYILSNGSLLNERFVELFNEFDISFGLSHDAAHQDLRCKDFLRQAEYIALLNRLKHFKSFNCVISRDNCDLVAAYKYLMDVGKDISCDWQLTFEMFELTQECVMEYMPSVEQYALLRKSYREIMELACSGAPHLEAYATRRRHRKQIPAVWRCAAERRLTVDCAGNVYHCQVAADRNDNCLPKPALPFMCINCRHADYCRGVCPLIPDRLRKKVCMCHHLFYDAMEEIK